MLCRRTWRGSGSSSIGDAVSERSRRGGICRVSEGEGRTGNGGDVSKCQGSRAERYQEGLTVGRDCGAQERFGVVQGGGRVVRSS